MEAVEWPLPALLRAARTAYGALVQAALADGGFEDLPPNGSFVLGAILTTGQPLGDIIRRLAVSKQTAGQLVDVLVLRGYVERSADPKDRRRLVLALSERGEAAANIIREAVETTEARLAAEVGPSAVEQTRRTLAALVGGLHD